VQKAFKIKPRRENKYFKGGPNISMILVPGGPSSYFDNFGLGE